MKAIIGNLQTRDEIDTKKFAQAETPRPERSKPSLYDDLVAVLKKHGIIGQTVDLKVEGLAGVVHVKTDQTYLR